MFIRVVDRTIEKVDGSAQPDLSSLDQEKSDLDCNEDNVCNEDDICNEDNICN